MPQNKHHSLKILHWALWLKPPVSLLQTCRDLAMNEQGTRDWESLSQSLANQFCPISTSYSNKYSSEQNWEIEDVWYPSRPSYPELSSFNCPPHLLLSQRTGIFKGIMLEPKDLYLWFDGGKAQEEWNVVFPGRHRQRKLGITTEEGSEKRSDLEKWCWALRLRWAGTQKRRGHFMVRSCDDRDWFKGLEQNEVSRARGWRPLMLVYTWLTILQKDLRQL